MNINQLSLMIGIGLCLLAPPTSGAKNTSDTQKQLKAIDQSINTLNKDLNLKKQSRGDLEKQLKILAVKITASTDKSRSLQRQITALENKQANIDAQRNDIATLTQQENERLNAHDRIAWRHFFSSPAALTQSTTSSRKSQLRVWSQYYRKSRIDTISRLKENQQATQRLNQEEQHAVEKLTRLKQQHDEETSNFRSLKKQNLEKVSLIKVNIKQNSKKIEQLKTDQAALEKVLDRLKKSLDDQAFSAEGSAFSTLQGKLPWPVKGRKRKPELKKGVYIATTGKQQVTSIAPGRVIYASTLKGFGQLVILDHGSGFMSLYGQNDQIFISVGDWVEKGQRLSSIASNRGLKKELYFEIRKNGNALPVKKWCQR